MPIELLTTSDLHQFRTQLVQEIRQLLTTKEAVNPKVLKTKDVCKLFTVTAGTLQNWRKTEKVRFTKIGGIIYYEYEEVVKLLKHRKSMR